MGESVALSDGGFIVMHDEDDCMPGVGLRGRRFVAAGGQTGIDFVIRGNGIGGINAPTPGAGRVAITYLAAGGAIGVWIIDPRDTANNPLGGFMRRRTGRSASSATKPLPVTVPSFSWRAGMATMC